jgi:endonuclease/exonuclease/phosphatase family metal-dependent hydrolase
MGHDHDHSLYPSPYSRIRERRGTATLRVLTYNIYGHNANWAARKRVVTDGLRALDPDIVTLQETTLTEGYDQAREVLGKDMHVAHSVARSADGVGIAIGTRWPILRTTELDLNVTPRTGDFPCTTLIVELDVPAPFGPVLVANHFPDWQLDHEYEREVQTVLAARRIEAMHAATSAHILLAGDLDADLDAASIRFLTGKQSLDGTSVCYRDAWDSVHPAEPGPTFTPENPLMREMNWDWPNRQIDHILVRCEEHGGPSLHIAACERAFDQAIGNVWGSDHIAVVADLVLPPRPRTAS